MKRTKKEVKYDALYNKERFRAQREKVISLLGGRCWKCTGFYPPWEIEILARPGMSIKVPFGGRYLRSMKVLEKDLLPFAQLLCKRCLGG